LFEIGRNSLGETDLGCISSDFCEIPTPRSFESFGFDDNYIILNLIGDTLLKSKEFLAEDISIFLNLARDVIRLN
jgi:hypothetical protein